MTVASKSYPLGTVLKLVYEGVGPDGKPLSNSVNAKKALLERFKARPGPDDPVVLQRRAEREAIR